jgi:hypothetical protein
MALFQVIRMEGSIWGVFIVNPNDNNDKYLVSGTFDREQDPTHFAAEFNRIAETHELVVTDSNPVFLLGTKRTITLPKVDLTDKG